MKTLVAFYSRTGTTKKIGEAIAEKIGADVEEIKDTVDRSGAMGYIRSGRDAMKKKLTKLEPLKFAPNDYDFIIIGTPIWGWNMSAPVRTYITEQKEKLKKVAFFCTMGGSGDKNAFSEMEKISGEKPVGTFAAKTKDVAVNNYSEKLEEFILKIKE
jgi:flavodoxin